MGLYLGKEKISNVTTSMSEIIQGTDTTDATATAADILIDKTAYVNGEKITGTIPNYGSTSITQNILSPEFSNGLLLTKTFSSPQYFSQGAKIQLKTQASDLGNATAADVTAGKTFTSSAGLKVAGTKIDSTMQINVITEAGATVTAINEDETISGIADSVGNCTLIVDKTGVWTVTATLEDETQTLDVTVGISNIDLSITNSVFSNNRWSTIIKACQEKQVPDTWKVGDSCNMTINNKTYQIDIIGKNHDDYADGSGKAPLTFQMHTTYATQYKMNGDAYNNCGWKNCLVRTSNAFPALKKAMPAEVVAAMKAVTKKTSAGNASSTLDTTEDTLFLLSEIEVQGTQTFSYPGEGTQYDYYKTEANRKKDRAWYLRSPRLSSTSCFDRTGWDGEADWSVASNEDGITAAWCF